MMVLSVLGSVEMGGTADGVVLGANECEMLGTVLGEAILGEVGERVSPTSVGERMGVAVGGVEGAAVGE